MKIEKVSSRYGIRLTKRGFSILERIGNRWHSIGMETSFQAAEKFIGVMCSVDYFMICSYNYNRR